MKYDTTTRIFLCLTAIAALTIYQFAGAAAAIVSANNTPQTLPFSQNWSGNLITTSDDWSPVPGIVGFRGDDLTTATGTDPRTIVADGSATPVDVNANQPNPDVFATGGVAEFDTITNPTVALQGSGTADAPFLVIYLNTTGQTNIRVQYNARDIDGSTDNAIQQINTQYRVGSTGSYINLPGGYIADATTGPSMATLVTPVDVTLPVAANNQPLVEVRIMTTNAIGNDEWVGIDDINITNTGTAVANRTNVDMNGDGRTDYVVTRHTVVPFSENLGILPKFWYIQENGSGTIYGAQWGRQDDQETPEDFDGDGKDDIAIWRGGPPTQAAFYILQSSTNTVRIDVFGQSGDKSGVVRDYDGDGKADPAVYREGAQSFFFFRGSLNNPSGNITYVPWGTTGDDETQGDFDGDGKGDFCVRRNIGGSGVFILLKSMDAGVEYIWWGQPTDAIVPGDYDGDSRSDFCVARGDSMGIGNFYILERDGGGTGGAPIVFGSAAANDSLAPGDYDGDGRQDIAIWRANIDPTQNYFWVRQSSSGAVFAHEWGQSGDRVAAEWYVSGGD